MEDGFHAAGPGVIVVAEGPLHALLADSGVGWRVQDRQTSVAEMWQHLSEGRLDQHSRILIFSDSLLADGWQDDDERAQTAAAVVAMAHAGATVFVARWRPESWTDFEALLASAATAQGVDPSSLTFDVLPVVDGGRAVLEAMRPAAGALAAFPDEFDAGVDVALVPGTLEEAALGWADDVVDTVEDESEVEAEIELVSAVESELESEAAFESELESEVVAELESEVEAEVESELESEAESELEAEAESEVESEARVRGRGGGRVRARVGILERPRGPPHARRPR